MKTSSLFLAQTVTNMAGLQTAIGRGLAIGVVFSALYMIIMLWRGLMMDRHDGSWKFEIAKGIGVFAAVGIANILFNVFYPGQVITVNFN